jgi:hypothetical protein
MVMRGEAFFAGIFRKVTEMIPKTVPQAESKRLIKYCLDVQKDGETDKDAAKNFAGYETELPSSKKSADGKEFLSKTKLFDACWAKALSETRRRVAIGVCAALYGVDFSKYKKHLPFLMLYCEAVEREMAVARAVFSKKIAMGLGVPTGKKVEVDIVKIQNILNRMVHGDIAAKYAAIEAELPKDATEAQVAESAAKLAALEARDFIKSAKDFGQKYRAALSRKTTLRNERIEIGAFDDEVDYSDYA